jgi:phosphoheptose isomerase
MKTTALTLTVMLTQAHIVA